MTYRPKSDANPDPCPNCFGYYETKQLWKHCKLRSPFKGGESEKDVVRRSRYLTPVPNGINKNTILSAMRRDAVCRAIINDDLITRFGQKITCKHFADKDRHDHIRAKMRELGRLLLELKRSDIPDIAIALLPEHFSTLLKAVRTIAGFSEDGSNCATQSLALKIGHSLRKCAAILKTKAYQEYDDDLIKRADAFEHLYTSEWEYEISSFTLRTLSTLKRNKPLRAFY